jgi:hypothetical protein
MLFGEEIAQLHLSQSISIGSFIPMALLDNRPLTSPCGLNCWALNSGVMTGFGLPLGIFFLTQTIYSLLGKSLVNQDNQGINTEREHLISGKNQLSLSVILNFKVA